jgi:hypothetical protein
MLGIPVFLAIATADPPDVMAVNTHGFLNRETMQKAKFVEGLL